MSNLIAFFALLVSILSAIYQHKQTQIAAQTYDAAIAQVSAANRATEVASQQLDLQKKSIELENQFSVVINNEDELQNTLSNGQNIKFSLSNETLKPVSYNVTIRSTGVGLYFSNQTPKEMIQAIRLDQRPVVVKPSENYQGSFNIWHPSRESNKAKISILVNNEVIVAYDYLWDSQLKKYIYKR